ncbi:ionotropic receptor 25a [Thrips palmi]|uniref:Ionotropic receptor 25a n=1 Tax=Thrips palmi TaxID=161013 RepID=A0A6P8Z560_THRPL|nr:ionotropic receptor 25a [Thrips palmi]
MRSTKCPSSFAVCTALGSTALVLDVTWSGWDKLRRLARAAGTPYLQADVSVRHFLAAADDVLRYRNVTDAALVFESEEGTHWYTRWMLVDTALATGLRDTSLLNNSTIPVTLLTPRASLCCALRGEDTDEGPCTCPQPRRLHEMLLPAIADLLHELAAAARARGVALDKQEAVEAEAEVVGEWSHASGYTPRGEMPPLRRYFRVGIVQSMPWAYRENGEWTGYCVDFVGRLASMMEFDYELVPSDDYGERDKATGRWSGALGDLVAGRTDLLAADLTMTAQREEAIDFVPPYFEQSGISIVIRKPVRKTSLFKFMTVLRLEVWLSIVGALVITALMVWLLDRFSPYSARNTKYPYPCRDFTLKESFWFALTSFTPQGGGEAPKALSGRTLVASYWLFVVLMLATFTANLAAFLTVERMQTPVQSLEQLARQSRINYTVVEGSEAHHYFQNMKLAEDTLYRVWKEITLNASSDETQYRVWDYPIKEQYGHILLAIERAGTLPNDSVGFQKVLDSEEAEFAFIHNAAHVRYEVSKNCNLTEVGEVFAEQPYALAIQQGSYLQEELSRRILELQKDRYFEALTAKYWNYSRLAECSGDGDNEGITLESLGGVFIATLCGLAFALLTLGAEVLYYKRKQGSSVSDLQSEATKKGQGRSGLGSAIMPPVDTNDKTVLLTKASFAALAKQRRNVAMPSIAEMGGRQGPPGTLGPTPTPGVAYISVFPRDLY